MATSDSKFDWETEYLWYRNLRSDMTQRNQDWWVLRQAFQGIYRWDAAWPTYKEKLRVPLLRKMVLTHAAFLMGQKFELAAEPAKQSASARKKATEAEKAVMMLQELCGGWAHINRSAVLGSLLGTSGFKTYMDEGAIGGARACFTSIQPELCYPVTKGDNSMEMSRVFYGYRLDRKTAALTFPKLKNPDNLKSEQDVEEDFKPSLIAQGTLDRSASATKNYVVTSNYSGTVSVERQRQLVPVLEVWDDERYALFVGGEEVENGPNPYGFIPYTLIPNIDAGFGVFGESDIDQVLELNEELNALLSDYAYTMHRWANPTLLWNRAPKNYLDVVAKILGGGGVIPLPVGSELRFLEYQGQPPDFNTLMDRIRALTVELGLLSELAFSGEAGGSINTGASLAVNFTNVTATSALKRTNWDVGLRRVYGQLAQLGAKMGDIGYAKAIGSGSAGDEGITLSGKSIGEHRRFKILWPGILPKDSEAAQRLEIEKMTAGVQSQYTTIEKLGAEFPEDELTRIEEEKSNENLNPEGVATTERARAMNTAADARLIQAQGGGGGGAEGDPTAQEPGDIEGDLEIPDDVGQLTDTGEDFGTDGQGNVRDGNGRQLSQEGADLARFMAANGRGQRPEPTDEEPPPEGEEDDEFNIV